MKSLALRTLSVLASSLALASPLALTTAGAAENSQYATQRHEEIKALTADERAALLAGQGMGFAKVIEHIRTRLRAAHLNAHLEQAALLSPAQIHRHALLRGHQSGGDHGH